jgi:hypothetical protein
MEWVNWTLHLPSPRFAEKLTILNQYQLLVQFNPCWLLALPLFLPPRNILLSVIYPNFRLLNFIACSLNSHYHSLAEFNSGHLSKNMHPYYETSYISFKPLSLNYEIKTVLMQTKQRLAQKICFFSKSHISIQRSVIFFLKLKCIILCYYSHGKQKLAAFVHHLGHLSGCKVFISSVLYGNPQNMDMYIIQPHTLHYWTQCV